MNNTLTGWLVLWRTSVVKQFPNQRDAERYASERNATQLRPNYTVISAEDWYAR